MSLDLRLSRGMLIVLGVAVAAASLVEPALADHGRRYKGPGGFRGDGGPRIVQRVYASPGRGYAYSRGSSAGPALAGLIGGLIIGSVIAQAAAPPHAYCPPAVADDYYYDPYCHQRFTSLDAYGAHLDRYDHPSWVRVIDGRSGRCVGERYWQDGRWRDRDDDEGDRDGGWNR